MTARLLDRRTEVPAPGSHRNPPVRSHPDAGYDSLARLTQLRDVLAALAPPRRSRWNEPPLFFFDRTRQEQLESTRPATPCDQFSTVAEQITAELPALCASVEARRVARAVAGLNDSAESLAAVCPAAKELADLLAVPDDEVVLVLHPAARTGFRLVVGGIADVGQFHILLADAIAGGAVSGRFVTACRDAHPAVPAGVPMVAEARFQLYTRAALQADGTLPLGFGGCEHWLWPGTALAAVPRVNGERVVLVGPPAYRATWDVARRFPAMAAEVRVLDVLSPFRVAEHLARLCGSAVPPLVREESEAVLRKAA